MEILRLRFRLILALALGAGLYFLLPNSLAATGRLLAAWDAASSAYLILAWVMFSRASLERIRRQAEREDESAIAILGLTVTAALASLGAIAVELVGIHNSPASGQALRLALAGGTIIASWFLLHTVFAIHYAHEFYGDGREERGLVFPGKEQPDYWDFMYFSVTIGAAAQTSDITIRSRLMRRLVLAHTILSFFFNTTILALAINVGASLL